MRHRDFLEIFYKKSTIQEQNAEKYLFQFLLLLPLNIWQKKYFATNKRF